MLKICSVLSWKEVVRNNGETDNIHLIKQCFSAETVGISASETGCTSTKVISIDHDYGTRVSQVRGNVTNFGGGNHWVGGKLSVKKLPLFVVASI